MTAYRLILTRSSYPSRSLLLSFKIQKETPFTETSVILQLTFGGFGGIRQYCLSSVPRHRRYKPWVFRVLKPRRLTDSSGNTASHLGQANAVRFVFLDFERHDLPLSASLSLSLYFFLSFSFSRVSSRCVLASMYIPTSTKHAPLS